MARNTFALVLAVCLGCSDSPDNNANSLGHSLGRNVTDFAQGVGSGVDNQLKINVELSEELTGRGVSVTVAKQGGPLNDPDKSISVYVIAATAIDATLAAKAYNADDLEIGRANANISMRADAAEYVGFKFPTEMDRQTVVLYRIDLGDSRQSPIERN